MSADWRLAAQQFLTEETEFHLGMLPTEQSHPLTRGLSQTLAQDIAAGIRMLQAVDQDVPDAAQAVVAGDAFAGLVAAMRETIAGGGRICFSGCGATGRLSIMLEACWRHHWQAIAPGHPASSQVISIMTGGDHALVRSVEHFEDYQSFGRQQVREAGLGAGDLLVAISEGGETSSVIGTIWEARERGARAAFAFNNPPAVLAAHLARSRAVIEAPDVLVLDLTTGPMAVAGSTRMQATTAELLVVGAALDQVLTEISPAGLQAMPASSYVARFRNLLADLSRDEAVAALAAWTRFEREHYRAEGLVTYYADGCLLDIFTDTTERAPTFMLPPFRKFDDLDSPPPWAFVKTPLVPTSEAWHRVLGRPPRCLDWDSARYAAMGASTRFVLQPPKLAEREVMKFQIGCEDDPTRYRNLPNAAVLAALGDEVEALLPVFASACARFETKAAIVIGDAPSSVALPSASFVVPCGLPATALGLFQRLAVKLAFNTVSTATMGSLGRLTSNWMAHVETTNKKLLDRGSRLVAELAEVDYETACYALHETLASQSGEPGRPRQSPVATTIERLRRERTAG